MARGNSSSTQKMSKSSKSSSENPCGLCGQNLHRNAAKHDAFKKKSLCCGKIYQNHQSCASKHVNSIQFIHPEESSTRNTSANKSTVSSSEFNKCQLAYNCFNCKVKNCFVCNKEHQMVKNAKPMHCNTCDKVWTIITPKCQKDPTKIVCKSCAPMSKASSCSDKVKSNASKTTSTTGPVDSPTSLQYSESQKPPSKLSENEEQSESSSPKTNQTDIPLSTIKRFVSHTNPHKNFLPGVPSDTYRDVLECIDTALSLNNYNEPFTFFSSDEIAKSFFNKKLGIFQE